MIKKGTTFGETIIKVFFFMHIFGAFGISSAQLPNASEYYPLRVGNEWIYVNPLHGIYVESDTLLGDTLRVYKVNDFAGLDAYYYYSHDSSIVYQAEDLPQTIDSGFPILDTGKGIGEKWVVTYGNTTRAFAIVDTGRAELFDQMWNSAHVYEVDSDADSLVPLESLSRYALSIGPFQFQETYLTYAKINGMEYGVIPSVEDDPRHQETGIPKSFRLFVYPNPVRSSVHFLIQSTLKQDVKVKVTVTDILGRVVRNMITQPDDGRFQLTWDGRDQQGNLPANGVYFVTIKSGNIITSAKFLLLR